MGSNDRVYKTIGIVCIFILALFLRVIPSPQEKYRNGLGQFGDTYLYHIIAHNLYRGNGFSGITDGKSFGSEGKSIPVEGYESAASRAPIYPFFIFGVYKFLGNAEDMESILTWHKNWDKVRIVQCVLDASLCVTVYFINRLIWPANAWPALFASILYCFSFYNIYYARALLSESLTTFWVTISLFFSVIGLKYPQTRWWWVASGAGFALTTLTRPEYILFIPFLGIFIFTINRKNAFLALKTMTIFMVSALIVIIPWTIRNYICFKEPIIVSTGGLGSGLFIGTYESNDWKGWRDFPDYIYRSIEEKKLVEKLFSDFGYYFRNGSIKIREVDAALTAIALDKLKSDPLRIVKLWVEKIPRLWYQNYIQMYAVKEPSGVYFIFYFFFALVAFFYKSKKEDKILMMPIVLLFFYLNCIFLPLHVEPRYGVTIMPGMICLAGIGLWKSVKLFFRSQGSSSS